MGLAASWCSDTGRLASSSVRSAAGALCRAAAALLLGLPLLLGFVAGAQADPEISISGGPAITEGEEAIFTLKATSAAPPAGLVVKVAIFDADRFIDKETGEILVTIPKDATSVTFKVATNENDIEQVDGEVSAVIRGRRDGGYRISTMDTAEVMVSDNDGGTNPPPPTTPTVRFSSATYSTTEGNQVSVTVHISPQRSTSTTVGITYADGTATGGDYSTGPANITIPANTGSSTFTVQTTEDSTVEGNETFDVFIGTVPAGVSTGSPLTATVTINDDDTTPGTSTVRFSRSSYSTSEGNGVDITVHISPQRSTSTTVGITYADGTATGGDYSTGPASITIPANMGSGAFTVPTTEDTEDENNETFTVSIGTVPTGVSTGSPSKATVTINDDDTTPTVRFSSSSYHTTEGNGVRITVNISPPSSTDTTLDITYTDGTATGSDYSAITSIIIPANRGSYTFTVPTTEDTEDESNKTFSVSITAPIGVNTGRPATATVTINDVGNIEGLLAAGHSWLARFGRTVAEQGLDSIAQRLRAPRTAGTRASVGGLDLFGTAGNVRQEHPKPFQDRQDLHAPAPSRSLNDVLPGSHFLRVGETDAHGGSLALWGRGAHTSFDGKEKDLALDGESTAVMLGADYARQDWLGGLILNHSEGEGGYRDPQSTPGDIEASLTTLIPWAALQAREDLQFWGALGVGKGDLELEPDGSDRMDTDIDWSMAAAGIRSDLISPGGNQGMSLTLVGDALWTRTGADRIEGLSVESGEVTRFRLGLEGDYGRVLETGAEVTPRLEVGVRQDGGDAETGAGFEFGGGMSWRDPDVGLKLELAGRTLMAHDSDDLEEEGFSVSLDYDPRPDSTRGLSLSVHQEVGARSTGGLDTLFSPEPLTSHDDELENRVRMEAAYGRPVLSGSFIAGPRAGLIHSSTARDYSLGWRLTTPRRSDLSLDIRALYLDHDGKDLEHAAVVEMMTHW